MPVKSNLGWKLSELCDLGASLSFTSLYKLHITWFEKKKKCALARAAVFRCCQLSNKSKLKRFSPENHSLEQDSVTEWKRAECILRCFKVVIRCRMSRTNCLSRPVDKTCLRCFQVKAPEATEGLEITFLLVSESCHCKERGIYLQTVRGFEGS